jgi:hypothetical protein
VDASTRAVGEALEGAEPEAARAVNDRSSPGNECSNDELGEVVLHGNGPWLALTGGTSS